MFVKEFEEHIGTIAITIGLGSFIFGIFIISVNVYNLTRQHKPTIVKKKHDKKNDFIENKKNYFLKSYESDVDFNQNIEKVFYIKDDYNKMIEESNNLLETTWKRRILLESTPLGNIIMFYNAYKHGFSYYSDEQIPYSILNSIAMKYVLTYYCRDFFIDNSIVPNDKYSPFLHIHEIEKAKVSSKKIDISKGPFAKLKTYTSDKKSDKKSDEKSDENENNLFPKDFIKNKFIFCGKIYQFSPLQSTPKKEVKKNIPMNYSDFKQWHNPERFELIPSI